MKNVWLFCTILSKPFCCVGQYHPQYHAPAGQNTAGGKTLSQSRCKPLHDFCFAAAIFCGPAGYFCLACAAVSPSPNWAGRPGGLQRTGPTAYSAAAPSPQKTRVRYPPPCRPGTPKGRRIFLCPFGRYFCIRAGCDTETFAQRPAKLRKAVWLRRIRKNEYSFNNL